MTDRANESCCGWCSGPADDAGRLHDAFRSGLDDVGGWRGGVAGGVDALLARPGCWSGGGACLVAHRMVAAEEAARDLACGIEYLHTASLVFDDLPSMDDAGFGAAPRPCTSCTGKPRRCLAALALINRGYALLWQGMAGLRRRARGSRPATTGQLGVAGLIGGQAPTCVAGAASRTRRR